MSSETALTRERCFFHGAFQGCKGWHCPVFLRNFAGTFDVLEDAGSIIQLSRQRQLSFGQNAVPTTKPWNAPTNLEHNGPRHNSHRPKETGGRWQGQITNCREGRLQRAHLVGEHFAGVLGDGNDDAHGGRVNHHQIMQLIRTEPACRHIILIGYASNAWVVGSPCKTVQTVSPAHCTLQVKSL